MARMFSESYALSRRISSYHSISTGLSRLTAPLIWPSAWKLLSICCHRAPLILSPRSHVWPPLFCSQQRSLIREVMVISTSSGPNTGQISSSSMALSPSMPCVRASGLIARFLFGIVRTCCFSAKKRRLLATRSSPRLTRKPTPTAFP